MLKLCRRVFLPYLLAHRQLLQQWDQPATDLAGYWKYLKMVRHLIWEEGAHNWGKIFVGPLPLSRESARDISLLPRKPLAITLHFRIQKYLRIISCHVNMSQCLDGVVTGLAEVWFFSSSLWLWCCLLLTVHSPLGWGIRQWCLSMAWLLPQGTQADCLTRGRAGCLEFWSAMQSPDCCNCQSLRGMSPSNKFCQGSRNQVSSYLSPPLLCREFLASTLNRSCNPHQP